MTTPSNEGLKFSDEERRKAIADAHRALPIRGQRTGVLYGDYYELAIDLQCRLNRAEELLALAEPFLYCDSGCGCAGRVLYDKVGDFLTSLREERES